MKAELADKDAEFKKGIADAIAELDKLKVSHKQKLADMKMKYEERLAKPAPQPAPACENISKQFLECKRMKLRAFNLPCGLKRECFVPNICASVPEGRTLAEVEKMELKEIRNTNGIYQ